MMRNIKSRDEAARRGAEKTKDKTKGPGKIARRYEVGPCYWRAEDGREYFFRAPTLADGASLWLLARDSRTLELNSAYSYLLLAGHFADTCVVAERGANPVAFVSAFVSPAASDTVFVWQIAVAEEERGRGLAQRLLHQLLARPACRSVRALEATVTPSNAASRALFRSLARNLRVPMSAGSGYAPELFPGGAHEREELLHIGPLPPAARGRALTEAGDVEHDAQLLETTTS